MSDHYHENTILTFRNAKPRPEDSAPAELNTSLVERCSPGIPRLIAWVFLYDSVPLLHKAHAKAAKALEP